MDKQFAFAVILLILGIALIQGKEPGSSTLGLGYGIIAMGSVWVAIRLVKEIKKK